jgi:hypothetical protein
MMVNAVSTSIGSAKTARIDVLYRGRYSTHVHLVLMSMLILIIEMDDNHV